jgi:phosphoketolase
LFALLGRGAWTRRRRRKKLGSRDSLAALDASWRAANYLSVGQIDLLDHPLLREPLSLAHAHGAAFDNSDLVVACVIGDGEAEIGPLAASWHSTEFVDPAHDGALLPILHLNGWKIASPTVFARVDGELEPFLRGSGYVPHFVEGDDPLSVHRALASELDLALDEIDQLPQQARRGSGPTS